MAIGWMTALKVIPWGDVIEATPGIVKSARKIFARSQSNEAQAEVAVAAAPGHDSPAQLQERLARLEAQLAQSAEQQQASAQLIESLAEQNARIVEAVEILRVRSRMLLVVAGVLAVVLVALTAWVLR